MTTIDHITAQMREQAVEVQKHPRKSERREMVLYGIRLFAVLAQHEGYEVLIRNKEGV